MTFARLAYMCRPLNISGMTTPAQINFATSVNMTFRNASLNNRAAGYRGQNLSDV